MLAEFETCSCLIASSTDPVAPSKKSYSVQRLLFEKGLRPCSKHNILISSATKSVNSTTFSTSPTTKACKMAPTRYGYYQHLSDTDRRRIRPGWLLGIPAKCYHPEHSVVDPRMPKELYQNILAHVMVTHVPAEQPEVPGVNVVLVSNRRLQAGSHA